LLTVNARLHEVVATRPDFLRAKPYGAFELKTRLSVLSPFTSVAMLDSRTAPITTARHRHPPAKLIIRSGVGGFEIAC